MIYYIWTKKNLDIKKHLDNKNIRTKKTPKNNKIANFTKLTF